MTVTLAALLILATAHATATLVRGYYKDQVADVYRMHRDDLESMRRKHAADVAALAEKATLLARANVELMQEVNALRWKLQDGKPLIGDWLEWSREVES